MSARPTQIAGGREDQDAEAEATRLAFEGAAEGSCTIVRSSGEVLVRRRGSWQRTACAMRQGSCSDACPLLLLTAEGLVFGCGRVQHTYIEWVDGRLSTRRPT